MKRGVTFEQVSRVADELKRQGVNPTVRAVRAELGTGSAGTINNHLAKWRAKENDREEQAYVEILSKAMKSAVSLEAKRLLDQTKDDYQDRVANLEAELERLAEENVAMGESAKDAREGLITKDAEIAHLREELATEKAAKEKARESLEEQKKGLYDSQIAAAEARVKFDTIEVSQKDLLKQNESMRSEIDELRKALALAEKNEAVALARLEAKK